MKRGSEDAQLEMDAQFGNLLCAKVPLLATRETKNDREVSMLPANSTPEKAGANTPSIEGPPPGEPRLLDQVRERIRYEHYSIRTERQYVYWVR